MKKVDILSVAREPDIKGIKFFGSFNFALALDSIGEIDSLLENIRCYGEAEITNIEVIR